MSSQPEGVDDDEGGDGEDQQGEPALQPVGVESGAQVAGDERGDGGDRAGVAGARRGNLTPRPPSLGEKREKRWGLAPLAYQARGRG